MRLLNLLYAFYKQLLSQPDHVIGAAFVEKLL